MAISSVFAPRRTVPLAARLDDSQVLTGATFVDPEQLADPADPRLPEDDHHMLLLTARRLSCTRALVLWPDQTLAWLSVADGPLLDALREAYELGRARLEQIHLLHDQPAGAALS